MSKFVDDKDISNSLISKIYSRTRLNKARQEWGVDWYYTYGLYPGKTAKWAGENSLHFVPTLWGPTVKFESGEQCSLIESKVVKGKKPLCKDGALIEALKESRKALRKNRAPRMRKLMAFNEPYSEFQANLRPQQAVNIYVKSVVPAAKALKLKLVAPAVGVGEKSLNWLADFMVACKKNSKCDLNLVTRLNFHMYSCRAQKWRDLFRVESNGMPPLYNRLSGLLHERAKYVDWDAFLIKRKSWITETNCNDEARSVDSTLTRSIQACKKATGESSDEAYGVGSLQAMSQLSFIERYSWWTTYLDVETKLADELREGKITLNEAVKVENKVKSARILNAQGMLTPMGRAYKNFHPEDDRKLCRHRNN